MKIQLTRAYQVAVDMSVLAMAFLLAWFARFDWQPPADIIGRIFLVAPYVVGFEYLVLMALGMHRRSWRYIGLADAQRVFAAAAFSTLCLAAARFALTALVPRYPYLRHGVIPLGVVATNGLLMLLGVVGVRALRRLIGERADAVRGVRAPVAGATPALLVGAGQAGVLVVRELARRRELGVEVVGFLDDDPAKRKTLVAGVPVLGPTSDLATWAEARGAEQVIITIATAPGQTIRRIRALATDAGLPVKVIPGLYELVTGQRGFTRVRDVAIEDLLRREPVRLDDEAIARVVRGQIVLVTGAGGSIGSELCRQACRYAPKRLLLVERAENALFEIHRELIEAFPELAIEPLVADVQDAPRMQAIFERARPSSVLHAAAHKHVPMMEWNPLEAVKNNVGGTRVVADLADAFGAESFVMISTDKAVNPSSIMGASKRAAEQYIQSLAAVSETRFVTVRFGNVLGSTGSVVPIFKEQIAAGGPVTVTHPEMRRYFMTIPEACQLVLQAGGMGRGAEIFILDMGEPLRIVDLARDLITLSGFTEGEDIEIRFVGVRPGEKLSEELSSELEAAEKTAHPKIFVGRTPPLDAPAIAEATTALLALGEDASHEGLIAALRALVPEYAPSEAP